MNPNEARKLKSMSSIIVIVNNTSFLVDLNSPKLQLLRVAIFGASSETWM